VDATGGALDSFGVELEERSFAGKEARAHDLRRLVRTRLSPAVVTSAHSSVPVTVDDSLSYARRDYN